jgi:hypothetical protein
MPDIIEQLGGIKGLADRSKLPAKHVSPSAPPPLPSSKPKPTLTAGKESCDMRSIHLRISSESLMKLDLLRLTTSENRSGVVGRILEEYLSSQEVEEALHQLRKTIK